MNFDPLIYYFRDSFTCSECRYIARKPLDIKHTKGCSTPEKIKIIQKDGIYLLTKQKDLLKKEAGALKKNISTLKKDVDILLREQGILEDDPKWIKDYIHALAVL